MLTCTDALDCVVVCVVMPLYTMLCDGVCVCTLLCCVMCGFRRCVLLYVVMCWCM